MMSHVHRMNQDAQMLAEDECMPAEDEQMPYDWLLRHKEISESNDEDHSDSDIQKELCSYTMRRIEACNLVLSLPNNNPVFKY